jgi:phospholipid/cholesterol/gamma-HCH transport system substrate-binding protein
MAKKKKINSLKLGVFVMAGLAFLILMLYAIGKNQNMFGKTFLLKVRFDDVRGLMPGNNIRFGGIDAGSVKSVDMLNDTTIEVSMLIKAKMKNYIRKNAKASITTDGLMGNKLLIIESAKIPAPFVEEGDILYSEQGPDTEEMLKVLSATNNDLASIAKELKQTTQRINSSKAIWSILSDESLPVNLRLSLSKIKTASDHMNTTMMDVHTIITDVKSGKGSLGELITDTAIAASIKDAVAKVKKVGMKADTISSQINELVSSINNEVNSGQGTMNALLKDKQMKDRFSESLKNIEQGTQTFNENMEALKHSFLFRSYFRKLEKQKKAAAPSATTKY